ncbi:unnamed protein product, partial [Ixodes hexagonus]
MVGCSVKNCTNRSGCKARRDRNTVEKAKFFRLPKVLSRNCERTLELSEKRRSLWIARINRPEMIPNDHKHMLSLHPCAGSPSALFDYDSPDWAPSLKLGHTDDKDPPKSQPRSRLKRTQRKEAGNKRSCPSQDKNEADAKNVDQPKKEDASVDKGVTSETSETLRHLKENLQKHLLR